jgi:hypothetical protein
VLFWGLLRPAPVLPSAAELPHSSQRQGGHRPTELVHSRILRGETGQHKRPVTVCLSMKMERLNAHRCCPTFRDFRKVGTTQHNPKVHSFVSDPFVPREGRPSGGQSRPSADVRGTHSSKSRRVGQPRRDMEARLPPARLTEYAARAYDVGPLRMLACQCPR